MKNLSLILNIVLFVLVGILFYLNFKKPQSGEQQVILPPASQVGGARIAWVNADTLDAKYERLKQQKEAIQQRLRNAENSLQAQGINLLYSISFLSESWRKFPF